MEVEFRDLSYTVRKYFNLVGEKKTILNNVYGKFKPGELCAIIGSSGAGKTTLLHAVSGYKTRGISSGQLLVNNTLREEHWFRRHSCYITQDDCLPSWMSVREALLLSSRLKGISHPDSVISELLDYLGLTECASTDTARLSGGQRKRTAVALELLGGSAGACFLDEPGSGLDDVAVARLQRLLRRLAKTRAVAVTLHQPTAAHLTLYDRLYVVAAGRCVYHGRPKDLVAFLAQNDWQCPVTYNPADFIIELVDNNHENIMKFSTAIQNGKIFYEDTTSLSKDISPINEISRGLAIPHFGWIEEKQEQKSTYAISGFEQFCILLHRYTRHTLRNKHSLLLQAIHYAVCGFLVSACFYNSANNGAEMFSQLKVFVGLSLFYSYTRFLAPILMIPDEIKKAKKENFNCWYGVTPYFFASTVASLPVQIIYNTVFIAFVYYYIGMPLEFWRFSMFVIISNLLAITTDGLGVAIASVFRPVIGLVLGPSISSVFLGLAIYGFDFAKRIPILMQWLMRTSPTRLGLSSYVVVAFGWGREKMDCDDVFCFFADPKTLLDFVGGDDTDLYREIPCLIFLMIAFRVFAYIALRWRFNNR